MNIPEDVRFVLDRLEAGGYEAYLVGGCVRDWVMGRAPADYDVTTNALPEQTLALFSDIRTLINGIAHGTVSPIPRSEPIEITTFRVDGDYSDHRHPERVEYAARIEDDLSRRDFTVNAMAYLPRLDTLIDPFEGRGDIARKLIHCVGGPERRFAEDALRMLRAYRFASKLAFGISNDVISAIARMCGDIRYVARERIYAETTKALIGPGASDALVTARALFNAALDTQFDAGEWSCAVAVLSRLPADEHMRWAGLLAEMGKERTCGVLERIRASRKTADMAVNAIEHSNADIPDSRVEVKRALSRLGERAALDAWTLKAARAPDSLHACAYATQTARDIIANGECVNLRGLRITGNELRAIGFTGTAIGATLSRLLDMVIDGQIENAPEALYAAAVAMYNV